jgi:lysyl-tRNA synthetase class 2
MPSSSVIRSFEYDPRRRELLIVFQSGRRYTYQAVPPATFEGLKSAASHGDYFNAHIREQFGFVREETSKSRKKP